MCFNAVRFSISPRTFVNMPRTTWHLVKRFSPRLLRGRRHERLSGQPDKTEARDKSRDGRSRRISDRLAARQDADLIVWDWDRLSRFSGFERQVRKVLPEKSQIICAKDGTRLHEASAAATFAHNERIAEGISRSTKEGMERKRADGAVFGNPEITTIVQPLGVTSYSNAAEALVCRIADVLAQPGRTV